MRFKILYILFFIAALLYNSIHLFGGLTPRNIMAMVMFLACVVEDRRVLWDKWFGIYLVFLLFFGLSSMLTGYLLLFIQRLVGYYFVGYVGYWSTKILLKKYNAVRLLVSLFLIIGFVDEIVTIGQFYNLPYFTIIPQYLGIGVDTELLENMDVGEAAMGLVLPGILGTDVYNGYFLMVVGILSFYFLRSGFRFIALIPWLLAVVASFMAQQRAPFYVLLIISVFILFKAVLLGKSQLKWILVVVFLALIPIGVQYLFDFLLGGDTRFNIGTESTGRDEIYQKAIDYINNNLFLGGYFDSGLAPHNMLLTAWIAGGFFGFVAIVVLTVMQLVEVLKLSLKKLGSHYFVYLLFGLAFVGFTMNSMFHNAGMTSGDFVIWTLWGAFLGYKTISEKQIVIQEERLSDYSLEYTNNKQN